MIKPIKKPNAGASKVAGKVKAVTKGARVMRGMKAPMNKHGVKPNIPVMGDDRTGGMTGAPSPKGELLKSLMKGRVNRSAK